jgi:hypothetical protein
MKDYIGRYVKRFESGGLGSLSLSSCGNDWGLSCGSYQLTLRWGNCIKFLKQFFPEESKSLYFKEGKDIATNKWPGVSYCSSPSTVKAIWKKCYNKVGEELFFSYEHTYIKTYFYEKIKSRISKYINLDESNRAF